MCTSGAHFRDSFEGAKGLLAEIHKWDDVEAKPVILVANKTDLVRSRIISKQGKLRHNVQPLELISNMNIFLLCHADGRQLATTNNCKYIETSCAISLNVDFLLAGIGAQINLKAQKGKG